MQLAPFDPLQPAEKTTIIFNPLKGIFQVVQRQTLNFLKTLGSLRMYRQPSPLQKKKNPPDQTPKTLP